MVTVDGNASSNEFVPETAADWDTINMDISSLAGEEVMLKFEAFNDNGSSIYLDNIRVYEGGPESVESVMAMEFTMFPNPAKDMVSLIFNQPLDENSHISVLSLQGTCLRTVLLKKGERKYSMGLPDIAAGVYLMEIKSSSGRDVRKLIIK